MSDDDQSRSKSDGGAMLPQPSSVSAPAYLRFRESHHAIARWFAQGLTISKVADNTGYSRRRLHILLADPTFQELVASYHADLDAEVRKDLDIYRDLSTKNMIRAELVVQDHLDDEENPPSLTMANKISQDRADRLGYGKNSTIKHEHTFADALDRAIERSARAKVINHIPKQIEAQPDPVPRSAHAANDVPEVEPRPSIANVLKKRKF